MHVDPERVAGAVRVPTADGLGFHVKTPAGEHLVVDREAKLAKGCTVAVFWSGQFALVGRLLRRPHPRRHLVIACQEANGNKGISRVFGLQDEEIQVWRVVGVFRPVPFADAG
jgi:hypothetical protein